MVLKRPRLLVLDEATSSIDTETEAAIQRGIHFLMERKTAIAIAHRLSTIRDVDTIEKVWAYLRGPLKQKARFSPVDESLLTAP